MKFFDGLNFVVANCIRTSGDIHCKRFKDYYGIQFMRGEHIDVSINDSQWALNGAWVLISYPGPLFRYGAKDGFLLDHSYICFKGPRVKQYIRSGLLPLDKKTPLIRITAPEHFQESMQHIIFRGDMSTAKSHEAAVNLLEGLLLQLCNQPEVVLEIPQRIRPKIITLMNEMREQPGLEWDFQRESRGIGISHVYFRLLFKRLSGLPPGEFLMQARITKAIKLLLETDSQICKIANECGFADAFYFSKIFKKIKGTPPLRFRKEFNTRIFDHSI